MCGKSNASGWIRVDRRDMFARSTSLSVLVVILDSIETPTLTKMFILITNTFMKQPS